MGRQCSRAVTNDTNSSSIPLLTWHHTRRHHSGPSWCPKPCTKYGNRLHPNLDTMGSSRFTTIHSLYPVAIVTRKGDGDVGSENAPWSIFGHMCEFSLFSVSECAYLLKGENTSSQYTNTDGPIPSVAPQSPRGSKSSPRAHSEVSYSFNNCTC